MKHTTTLIAILATLAFATACGEEAQTTEETPTAESAPESEEATEEATEEAAEPAAEQPAQADEGSGEAAGGSVCARAVSCCEAYVETMAATTPTLNAETVCASVRQLQNTPNSDQACQTAIGGWRTGLQAAQQTVPDACAE